MTDLNGHETMAISSLVCEVSPTTHTSAVLDPQQLLALAPEDIIARAPRPENAPKADSPSYAAYEQSRNEYLQQMSNRFRLVREYEQSRSEQELASTVVDELASASGRLALVEQEAFQQLIERANSRAIRAIEASKEKSEQDSKGKTTHSEKKNKARRPARERKAKKEDKEKTNSKEKKSEDTSKGAAERVPPSKGDALIAAKVGDEAATQTPITSSSRRRKRKNEDQTQSTAKKSHVEKTEKIKKDKPEKAKKKPLGTPKQFQNAFDGIWRDIIRKDIPKVFKIYQAANTIKLSNARKTAALASKEARRWQFRTNRNIKDMQSKGRRAVREMIAFWKKNEREERDLRRKAEKEALEQARKLEEERESRRQARKLNFLITQTELYSHFVGSKIKPGDSTEDVKKVAMKEIDFDAEDEGAISAAAHANAQQAVKAARERAQMFDDSKIRNVELNEDEMNFQNPTSLGESTVPQPKLLKCQLKEYQLKGLNWLANLYEQGINGILADEMGLGKTVQSISVMAYLAEHHDIWGPFLVIAPASTLHNWQQEIDKFVPEFKVLPYWGSNKDRKILRKFWDRKQLRYGKNAKFHVLVTSYQLVVADAQYFNRMRWQYMILDEAQAIKSSSSSRWKSLLSMQCRNRLLLTGTPIQNSMQELWALLHFIMPTLFDSHEEFSDWFSKDIESHATKNSQLNEQQLKRLHMILKPFMLRRVKKHVQQELSDKIEIDVYCSLTHRQRALYRMLKSQISVKELIERAASDDTQNLMNLVMQFRKVCNHPDLFERSDVTSAFSFGKFGRTLDFAREGPLLELYDTVRNCIEYKIPKKIYRNFMLEIPSEDSDAFVRGKIARMLTVWTPENTTVKAASFIENTPAGQICREARLGLFERACYSSDPIKRCFKDPSIARQKPLIGIDIVSNYLQESYLEVHEPLFIRRATAPPIAMIGPDAQLVHDVYKWQHPSIMKVLMPLTLDEEWFYLQRNNVPPSNLYPPPPRFSYSTIMIPSMNRFVSDSGKLARLDTLLADLKQNGHRVLIYFQMTKMMDLMEEYLAYRQYKYVRLDGSSKLGDRRDLVNDWQTRPDLFVFLLSTRAGGLGINLTAADTVIFYDSDWNPTIDSQAMDRAHRLGQTRQVTVYRLLVKGTIEERMRDRAKQKEHVQQVVMEGRGKQADFQKSGREVAYWLLDEDDDEVNKAIKRQEELVSMKPKRRKKEVLSESTHSEHRSSLEQVMNGQN